MPEQAQALITWSTTISVIAVPFATVFGIWLKGKMDRVNDQQKRKDETAELTKKLDGSARQAIEEIMAQERADIRAQFQSLIQVHSGARAAAEAAHNELRGEFRSMQKALAECERMHNDLKNMRHEDLEKIDVQNRSIKNLQSQNRRLAGQIEQLQLRGWHPSPPSDGKDG